MNEKHYIVHPLIKPHTLEARIYQQTILASCAKENVLVVLPTGLGKTAIMLLIAVLRLEKFPQGFVLVLAPSKPLVEQHKETFQRILTDPELVCSMTGAISPTKRQALWKNAKITIATPQIVQNDLISGIFRPEQCIALEIDEAHRTRGNYAYVFVAQTYLKRSCNPLISAFTASPGTSFEEIQAICDILEITRIESRTETDPDVRPYVQPVAVELIRVKLSQEFQTLRDMLKKCLGVQLKRLEEGGFKLPYGTSPGRTCGTRFACSLTKVKRRDVLELQKKIQEEIQSGVHPPSLLFEALGAASNTIRLLHGQELLETQGLRAFSNYLHNLTQRKQTQALRHLTDSIQQMLYYAEKLAKADSHLFHPKFGVVKQIVAHQLAKNPNSRILIFSRFRVTLKLLDKELGRNSLVKSHVFIGQQTKAEDRGMTQREQSSTLRSFREGKINVLLATNIGEEGIDITTCDLVIFYDAVSPIRTIQRRGRTGRKAPGRVVVLVTTGTQEEGIYWISQRKEKEMHKTMKLIANYSKTLKNERKPLRDSLQSQSLRSHRTLDKFVKEDAPAGLPSGASGAPIASLEEPRRNSLRSRKEQGIIAVDQRETNSAVVKCLYDLGFDVELRQLRVADYVVGDVAIERKTAEDFVQSLLDGRLFREAKNLTMDYSIGVLIIEGEKPFIPRRAIDSNALKGAIASIIIDFKLPVLQTGSPEETADLIAAIARRVLLEKRKIPRITTGTIPITLGERQKRIIAALPNINSVLVTRLFSAFKTPKNILLASKADLEKVKGVGPTIAAMVRETIDSEYSE